MAYQLMKDGDATRRLLEYVGDTQGGKRTLSRLSRTCRGFCEPGLGLLWKELDSLMPLVTLFPSTLYKRARRPGLGLAIMPIEEDWKQILHYGEFVRRLTYDESQKAVSPSFFPVIEEYRPRTYILPNLTTLVWRATTPAGLERIQLFLNPDLQNLVLEIGARLPELSTFLVDLSLRTRLASLSLSCPHTLPENFPHLLEPQDELEKLALMAPGALSAGVGKWAASLPMLRSLELDLTGRSGIAVEGFFDDILSMDGYHTPSSASDSSGVSRDSGVFSAGEDIDFTSIKKSTLQLVEDRVPRIGAFARLQSLHLTGEVGNVVTFLKHIASPLVNLELVVEDPFDKADWQDLCYLICQYFGDTLQSLKVTASSASRFADLVRSTPRGDTFVARRLPLDGLSYLPCLTRLEIDLPESIILRDSDIASVARVCPNIEVLRLCPAARFSIPSGGPTLSLEGLAALTMGCRNLHTLAVVVNGSAPRTDDVYFDLCVSSRSLMRLQLGHSWVRDPLQIAILLSHLAPRLDMLKWFHDKNRPGYIETHAQGWQRVFEFLPYLQEVRLTERWVAQSYIPEARNAIMVDRGVDATVSTCDRSVGASVSTTSAGVQCMPQTVNRSVEARVMTVSVEVDATPTMADAKVEASPSTSNASVEARPDMVSEGVDARPTMISESVDARPVMVSEGIGASPTMISEGVDARPIMVSEGVDATHSLTVTKHVHFATPESTSESDTGRHYIPQLYIPQAVSGAVSLAWRAMVFGPNFVTARIYDIWTLVPFTGSARRQELRKDRYPEKPAATADEDGMEVMDINSPTEKEASPPLENGNGHSPVYDTDRDSNAQTERTTTYGTHAYEHYAHESISFSPSSSFLKAVDHSAKEKEEPEVSVSERKTDAGAGAGLDRDHAATRQSPQVPVSRLAPTLSSTAPYTMSDNRKQEKDFTKEVDEAIPQAKTLQEAGKLQEALDKLFALEKQTRNAADLKSTTRLVTGIIELAYNTRDYVQLNSSIHALSKKHGQLKAAAQAMVELAMTWLEDVRQREGLEKWLELVETLRSVTEGKIFLETPRARVTLFLAQYHESLYVEPTPTSPPPRESLITASDLLSELQVETYSSMERKEKTEFILHQMRLLIEVAGLKDKESEKEGKDLKKKNAMGGGEAEWVKVRVASRKISEDFLKEEDNEALKLTFYDMMVQYGLRHHAYLDIAKCYRKVWETPSVKADVEGKGRIALERIVYYVILAPHDNEQSDMMHKLFIDPAIVDLEPQHQLLKSFTDQEIMRWPGIESVYGAFLRKTEVFKNEKHWEDLHTRVIEHNVRIIAQYYSRITLARLMSLLDLPAKETEETLSRLVVSGSIWARIDRPAGIVNFRNTRSAEEVMNDWSSDMQKLLGFVEKAWMGMNAAQAAQSRVKA